MKKKYHLVKWKIITKPKKNGDLGIKDLKRRNRSLLCKWWWKLEHEEGVWQEIVKKKYLKNNWISHITQKPSNSPT